MEPTQDAHDRRLNPNASCTGCAQPIRESDATVFVQGQQYHLDCAPAIDRRADWQASACTGSGAAIVSQHQCVMHAQSEEASIWYYRDSADGVEYLCATAYAQLPAPERLAWRFLPESSL
jgi:hypothetical protein